MVTEAMIRRFFTVVYEKDGRMYPCNHKHLTAEAAHDCVKTLDGLSIIEWVKDRRPQFSAFWTRSDMVPPN